MVASFFLFWSGLSDAPFSNQKSSEEAWFFCGDETKESLEGHSFVFVLDVVDGKK